MSAFYILSKIFFFFITPANWILILLLCSASTKRILLRKKLLIAAVLLFIVFSNEALLNTIVNHWQPKRVEIADQTGYSAAILLGGISGMDKQRNGYLLQAADRLVQTFMLYKKGAVQKIIITGGSAADEKIKEADFLSSQLVKMGVNQWDILVENTSRNTYENAVNTKHILDSLQLKPPYVLVTSALHIKRATMVFTKAGVPVIAYPANYIVFDHTLKAEHYFLPRLEVLDTWKFFIKEILGIWIYKLTGKA